ncbi:DUF397 domain-containing protein [Actinomadura gamaensis]|uniref:DUF397 domain-containing protein n=1 Tax=Actinomadura gamaensis TaxID=1763541 RepID=A0ABV9UBL9_9ACTN
MAKQRPPSMRMRRLATELRTLREERGLGLDEASALLCMSKSSLHRLERAQVIIRARDVNHALVSYGVQDEGRRRHLLSLAQPGRSKKWIKHYSRLLGQPVVGETIHIEQDALVPDVSASRAAARCACRRMVRVTASRKSSGSWAGPWRKSSHGDGTSSEHCVELALLGEGPVGVGVRDSKDPDGAVLALASGEWRGLLGAIKG